MRATYNEYCAEVTGNFTKAMVVDKTEQAVRNAFNKTGDTVFKLNNINVVNPDGLFVPLSMLNDLRRQLYSKIIIETKYGVLPAETNDIVRANSQWIVKTDDVSNLQDLNFDDLAEIIVLLNPKMKIDELKGLPKNKVRLALPAVCRNVDVFVRLISSCLGAGYKKWEIANYWGLSVLPEKGIDLSFDTSIYTLNSQAVKLSKEMGAKRIAFSVEDTEVNILTLNDNSILPTTLVVYQDTPLFISANCIRSHSCSQCNQQDKWFDLKKDGVRYKALSRNCQLILLGDKPFSCVKIASKIKPDFYRADFCYKKYTPSQVKNIMNNLMGFEAINNTTSANIERNMDMF